MVLPAPIGEEDPMYTTRKRILGALFAAAMVPAVAACTDSAGPEEDVTVEDVAEADPEETEADLEETDGDEASDGDASLIGQTVTVSGEISEISAENAFWISAGGGLFDEGAPILSPTADFSSFDIGDPASLEDSDTIIQVTGTVTEFFLVDFEEGWGIDLVDEGLEELEGEAVIVAEEVTTLAGEDVTISGEVNELLSTVAFDLRGAGWSVVVLDADQAVLEPGDAVDVTGTVRQLNTVELEEDYGLDLDDDLYAPYEGDLVLVADSVEPTQG